MPTGNVKVVAPTESTHVCGLKKIMKVEKKKKKRTLDIHLKTSKHRIGTYKKINDDMNLGNVKMVVPTESTLSVD